MRRYDIDWLRIFGILLLFPFHAARVFDPYELNYVQSTVKLQGMSVFMTAVWPWFMPLMFLVAGISAYFAMHKRGGDGFIRERVRRLLIPLIFGVLLIVPIQGYMARLQQGTLQGGYLHYFFVQFLPDFSDLSGYRGTFTPAHLWFILFLFLISLITLPLCLEIRARVKAGKTGAVSAFFQKGWALPLLFLPLTVSEALPDIGGKNIFFYALYYLIGFCIAAYDAWSAIDRIRWQAFASAVLGLVLYPYLTYRLGGYGDFAWQSIVRALVRNAYGITALLAMLAFAKRKLNRPGKVLSYLNGAAFPVYILHQSVMMALAYFIVSWPIGIAGQYTLIALSAALVSVGLYEVLRHIPPARFILGIKR